ncbi:MAG: YfiR family protein [Vicinamibacterales bacterium]
MIRHLLSLLAALAVLAWGPDGGRVAAQSADVVKAAFVFNVLNFVEWPTASFPLPSAPLRIAVIAPRTPGEFVSGLAGRVVRGHPIAVQTYDRVEVVEPSHVLFLSADAHGQLRTAIAATKGQAVLTIAEQNLDAAVDTAMALGVVQAKLAFAVNLDVTDAAGLQVNPNLLRLARSVKGSRARPR